MKKVIIALLSVSVLFGCQSTQQYSGDVYTADQAKMVQTVKYGTIESVKMVKIEASAQQRANNNAIGTIAGAVLGGVVGNAVGGGKGNNIATVGGALGGAMVGSAIADSGSLTDALQIVVRLDSGESIVVVQGGQMGQFSLGQRVRLISDGNRTTVSG